MYNFSGPGDGDPAERKPKALKQTNRCFFVTFAGFLLVGHADVVQEKTENVEDCKQLCKNIEDGKVADAKGCKSLMYFTGDKSCVATNSSRLIHPELFAYFDNETVLYAEYRCDIEDICLKEEL